MEKKKAEKFDMRKRRGLFLWIGLNISLLLVISAFEWKSEYDTQIMKHGKVTDIYVEIIPITKQEEPKPPKPIAIAPIIKEAEEDDIIEDIKIILDPDELAEIEPIIEDIEDEPKEIIWEGIVESMPAPVNGYAAFYAFISKNIIYPKKAQIMGIEGKVFVQFVIDKKGKITDIKVIRGIGMGCDEETLRVMKLVPAWNAGKQRGKPVKVRMVLPITFKLG